jgi:16S rRNA C1402 (ribose-2'-O) methylase RsmI
MNEAPNHTVSRHAEAVVLTSLRRIEKGLCGDTYKFKGCENDNREATREKIRASMLNNDNMIVRTSTSRLSRLLRLINTCQDEMLVTLT